jgi:site-specific recombinase XerD
VFLHDGVPVKPQAAKTAMRRVWKRAGITKPRPWKTLRATFATRKAEAGVDVPTLAALMGLTTSHVLEHYVKPSGVHLAGAMADVAPSTGLVASN